jgi:Xaa-Pro aminopeptidase
MLHASLANGGEEDMIWLSSAAAPPPHGKRPPASDRRLEQGDILVCEYHAKYLGYLTGAELSVAVGEPDKKYRELHRVCYESQRNGIANMQPGRPMREAVEGFRNPIIKAGLGSVECGLHGHGLASPEFPSCMYGGIGGAWHDHPYARVPEIEFAPNMVFGTASDLYDPAWNDRTGLMLGRTILITPAGPEELTGVPLDPEIIVV